MRIEHLDTPVAIVDLGPVEDNIARMQTHCTKLGLKLRPHIKTHKLPILAHKQLQAGAVGITCQKIGEAEVMAAAGIKDILISYNLMGQSKIERLAQVASQARISVAIDNQVALSALGAAAKIAGSEIGVLIEFDSGSKRTGVQSPQEIVELARKMSKFPHLRFLGLMTYPSSPTLADWIKKVRPMLKAEDLKLKVISAGGTPATWQGLGHESLTEVRPGTYVYNDRMMLGYRVAKLKDCALNILATVISRPTSDRAVIDAGSKTFSSDRLPAELGTGFGYVLEYPQAIVERFNEEHGMIDLSRCTKKPAIGERLRIIPNHACVVTNLHDEIVAHRDGLVEAVWPVWARGKTR
jgi:D-serine deaminase-like pyridoxal phosphate-dependent protein